MKNRLYLVIGLGVALRPLTTIMRSGLMECVRFGGLMAKRPMKTMVTTWLGMVVTTALVCATEPTWQDTLRSNVLVATSNFFCFVPIGNIGRTHYNVPVAAAKVLENRPSEELLPFLSDLRAKSDSNAASIVDQWEILFKQQADKDVLLQPGDKILVPQKRPNF